MAKREEEAWSGGNAFCRGQGVSLHEGASSRAASAPTHSKSPPFGQSCKSWALGVAGLHSDPLSPALQQRLSCQLLYPSYRTPRAGKARLTVPRCLQSLRLISPEEKGENQKKRRRRAKLLVVVEPRPSQEPLVKPWITDAQCLHTRPIQTHDQHPPDPVPVASLQNLSPWQGRGVGGVVGGTQGQRLGVDLEVVVPD
ncbi:unnamed protein product [Pleuronectes platessa]|uniref:Uncharacterized protein n=1 Tax=Pleuronectes platessa TaxID=8262 RepID=A0A9N7Z687_PLEPL|nr:unnamed protein product [Pleuronectes platessa]